MGSCGRYVDLFPYNLDPGNVLVDNVYKEQVVQTLTEHQVTVAVFP